MFYLVLLLLVLLGGLAVLVIMQNISAFLTDVQLTFIIWHLPPLPLGLFVVLALFFGGLLLYLVALNSAQRDRAELQRLRDRVGELSEALTQARAAESAASQPTAPTSPRFSQSTQSPIAPQFPQASPLAQPPQQNFPPPIVPIPGFPGSSSLPGKKSPQPPAPPQGK